MKIILDTPRTLFYYRKADYKVQINAVLKGPVVQVVSFEYPEIEQIHLILFVLQYNKFPEVKCNEHYFFDY